LSVTDHDTKLLNSDNRELSIIGFLKKLPTLGVLFGSGSLELLIVFIISATSLCSRLLKSILFSLIYEVMES